MDQLPFFILCEAADYTEKRFAVLFIGKVFFGEDLSFPKAHPRGNERPGRTVISHLSSKMLQHVINRIARDRDGIDHRWNTDGDDRDAERILA